MKVMKSTLVVTALSLAWFISNATAGQNENDPAGRAVLPGEGTPATARQAYIPQNPAGSLLLQKIYSICGFDIKRPVYIPADSEEFIRQIQHNNDIQQEKLVSTPGYSFQITGGLKGGDLEAPPEVYTQYILINKQYAFTRAIELKHSATVCGVYDVLQELNQPETPLYGESGSADAPTLMLPTEAEAPKKTRVSFSGKIDANQAIDALYWLKLTNLEVDSTNARGLQTQFHLGTFHCEQADCLRAGFNHANSYSSGFLCLENTTLRDHSGQRQYLVHSGVKGYVKVRGSQLEFTHKAVLPAQEPSALLALFNVIGWNLEQSTIINHGYNGTSVLIKGCWLFERASHLNMEAGVGSEIDGFNLSWQLVLDKFNDISFSEGFRYGFVFGDSGRNVQGVARNISWDGIEDYHRCLHDNIWGRIEFTDGALCGQPPAPVASASAEPEISLITGSPAVPQAITDEDIPPSSLQSAQSNSAINGAIKDVATVLEWLPLLVAITGITSF